MLFYIHVFFKYLDNVYERTYVSHFVNILSRVFFSGLQFSALWSHKLLLNLLLILPIEIDGTMAGYCVTLRSLIYLHQFVVFTIWYPNLCVFLSQLLLNMA